VRPRNGQFSGRTIGILPDAERNDQRRDPSLQRSTGHGQLSGHHTVCTNLLLGCETKPREVLRPNGVGPKVCRYRDACCLPGRPLPVVVDTRGRRLLD
jgi:hypothetical protein